MVSTKVSAVTAIVQLALTVICIPVLQTEAIQNLQPFAIRNNRNTISSHSKQFLLSTRGGGATKSSSSSSASSSRVRSKRRRSKPSTNHDEIQPTPIMNMNQPYDPSTTQIGSEPISNLLSTLQTDVTMGLTDEEAQSRIQTYGPNKLKAPPKKSLFRLIIEQFNDKLVQILLAVATLSGIFCYFEMKAIMLETGVQESLLKSFVEPIVIVAILVLNAIVGVWQEKSAEGSLEALEKLQPSLATVLRDGVWRDNIDSAQLVPGDIIKFRVGDKISADARILSMDSATLSLDEGSLTGESVTVQKLPGDEGLCDVDSPVQDMQSVVFSGTVCTAGSATALVIRTGMTTEIGKIQKVRLLRASMNE